MDFLLTKGYITDKTSGKINVEKLTGGKQALGNGTGETDIYKIVESNGTYIVNYYNEEGTPEEICSIKDSKTNSNIKTLDIIFSDEQRVIYTIQYEEGMTWGEWLDSKYNTISLYRYEAYPHYIMGNVEGKEYSLHYVNDLYYDVETNQIIDENITYQLGTMPK